ncbi:replicative DNA helicase [Sutcliffiella cohnii]|uniref:Replicative DNA helicase n=1 Tax=Sutcliffiella cohnii TaxID=33932 RepID=A0A223KNR1_9BACI|nr:MULTISPECIES: replicative DNA helicase [Sutcliffiella]AST91046.1 replicative DNA helicase [Sutcliffiella cohnii]MED4018497.1 replicative DNA helicase [Sutcliffiella cohnii]WBL16848.1 replicative DNA helicase [Sutcliffiella sp. NC1]
MDKHELKEITSGYRERMRRLALFDPLFELDRKRETDINQNTIDMKGLGLLSLLFFFENKLLRQYKTGVKELASFLKSLVSSQYVLNDASYERLARTIIQTFRPTTGRKRDYSYFNWEEQREQFIEYSILKANAFDLKTNTQYYTLDEDGLELVFATKEFYSEFQLSINQLMLRKQLDKGEFKGALRQINEMRIDVESLEERMNKLKHEIQRSIVSEETFERYKQLLEDIYGRLIREDEEFKELRQFVKETRERLFSKDIHKKEVKTYELIVKITGELESVHYDHSRLLDKTLSMKNTTLLAAQESLYYTGIQSFNFDQDIVSKIVSTPLPMDAMKGVLHPFLQVEQNVQWSPLTVFAEQNISEEREEKVEQSFLSVLDEEPNLPYRNWLKAKFKELMQYYLLAFEEEKISTLTQFMDYLDRNSLSSIYEQRYFYDFWIILHQRSPIVNGELDEEEGKTLLGDAISLLETKILVIQEGNEIINRYSRYSIQDMEITLEEN